MIMDLTTTIYIKLTEKAKELQTKLDIDFVPKKTTPGAAACDLRVTESKMINPGDIVRFPLGIMTQIDPDYYAEVHPRSGWGSMGVTLVNSTGIIDSDYRGEWQAALINLSDKTVYVQEGDRVCQFIIKRKVNSQVVEVTELDQTGRGIGGFGSTGTK